MIPIKQHNEIVQKLMKQLTNKQTQIKTLTKQKNKPQPQTPQLAPTQTQKTLNFKINQLNKQYKDKINTLTQQIRNKSLQNKDLKQRLTSKANIQAKQKQHVAQMLKRSYDRKPSSAADYKISALITHYQAEITKKTKFIQTLQKQIRQYEMNMTKDNQQPLQTTNQNLKLINQSQQKLKNNISFVQHQKQVNRYKTDMTKYKRLFEERQKEYKDLARRYSQLTNQYYKIINSYGIEEPKNFKKKSQDYEGKGNNMAGDVNLKKMKSQGNMKKIIPVDGQMKKNVLSNLLQEMIVSDSQTQDFRQYRNGMSKYPMKQIQPDDDEEEDVSYNNHTREDVDVDEQQFKETNFAGDNFAVSRIQQIMKLLMIAEVNDIIPRLTQMKTKISQFQLADTIVRSLQVFFYNVGKGKIIKSQLVRVLQQFQISYNRNLQAVDLLDEICIQIGAKRQKVNEKLAQLLSLKEQYYSQMKNMKYIQQLSKANKVVQFIQFFQLDRDDLALPQQLMQVQEQLKAINKYVKEVRIILEVDEQRSTQMVLELALRYMEKASSLVNNYERKQQKVKNTN